MAKLIYGDRIGATAQLRTGCSATIFDTGRERILLTRRTDNGRWCLPGGVVEPGESVEETCIREVWEETGLNVRVVRLIGIYSSPDRIVEYADGNRWQFISLSFEAEIVGGVLGLSNETTEFGYFTPDEIKQIDVMEHHLQRIEDALAAHAQPFLR
ncbi:MAG: NUDIX domain-containing protein [Chloroflexota bacterium]